MPWAVGIGSCFARHGFAPRVLIQINGKRYRCAANSTGRQNGDCIEGLRSLLGPGLEINRLYGYTGRIGILGRGYHAGMDSHLIFS